MNRHAAFTRKFGQEWRILGAEEAVKLTSRRPKPAGHPVIVTKDCIGLGGINFWMLGCFCEVVRIMDTNGDSHARGGVFDAGEDAGFRRFIPKNGLPESEQMHGSAGSHDGL